MEEDDDDTPLGLRILKGVGSLERVRVVTGVRGPKRRAETSPNLVGTGSLSDGGSPVLRPHRRCKVALFESEPDNNARTGTGSPLVAAARAAPVPGEGVSGPSKQTGRSDVARSNKDDILVLSSDEGDIATYNLRTAKKAGAKMSKNKKKRKVEASKTDRVNFEELEEEEAFTTECIGPCGMVNMAASALYAEGLDCIDELEEFRSKSTNLKGSVSGAMRKRFAKLKDMIVTLTGKAEAIGDPSYLRSRTGELMAQVRELKQENQNMKGALEEAMKRISDLGKRDRNRDGDSSSVVTNVRKTSRTKEVDAVLHGDVFR